MRSTLPNFSICSRTISSVISSEVMFPRKRVEIEVSSGGAGALFFSSILSIIFLAIGSLIPLKRSRIFSSIDPLPFLRLSRSYSVMLEWRYGHVTPRLQVPLTKNEHTCAAFRLAALDPPRPRPMSPLCFRAI